MMHATKKKALFTALILSVLSVASLLTPFKLGVSVQAADEDPCSLDESSICSDANMHDNKGSDTGVVNVIKRITDMLMYGVGVVSVIMIIVSGIRYISAHGDKTQATAARNTLIYSVVGLIVTISAYTIVTYILDQFIGKG